MSNLSHDELMAMTDDEKYAWREKELEEIYQAADPERRKRLEALQWRVDIKIKNAPNAIAGMIEIQKIMLDSAADLVGAWNGEERAKTDGTVHVLKA